ncbi:MAG: hypothetical protein SFZ24_00830 [Planctomycetota bacterium]|nr:hypothetical protein [Planctomycetota bacterium]
MNRAHRVLRRGCLGVALVTLWQAGAAGPALAKITIADLAPPNAVVVAGCDDSRAMYEAYERSGLKAIFSDPRFRTWFEKHSKETFEQMAGDLEGFGLKLEDFKRPAGALGVAAWIPELTNEELAADGGPDARSAAEFVMMADFGEDAAAMDEAFVRALTKGQEQNKLQISDWRHGEIEVRTYSFVAGGEEEGDLEVLGQRDAFAPKEVHYARHGEFLLLSSEKQAMERSLDRVGGEAGPSIRENATFQRAVGKLDEPQFYAAYLSAPGREFFDKMINNPLMQDEEANVFAKSVPGVATALGLNEVQAASFGFNFAPESGMMEQRFAALVPNKTGLVALFDAPSIRFAPPSFIGPDVQSVTMLQFNLGGLIPLVNQVVAKLPEELRAQSEGMVMGVAMAAGPILANLGPEITGASRLVKPFGAASQEQLWALRVKDANVLQQALAGLFPSMGFESRDFQGNQIWSPAAGGMMPAEIAVAIGFGHLLVGPPGFVEDALRQGGAGEAQKLADEAGFKQAVGTLGEKGIGYSFNRIADSLRYLDWTARNHEKIVDEQMKEIFGEMPATDEEERAMRDETRRALMESTPGWMREPLPIDVVLEHVGDSVTEWRSTADGFEGEVLILRKQQ